VAVIVAVALVVVLVEEEQGQPEWPEVPE